MFVLDNEGNRLSAKYYHKSFLNNTDKVCPIPILKSCAVEPAIT